MLHFLCPCRRRASPIVPVNHFSWACYLFLPVLLCVSSFAQRSHWPGLTSAEGIPWAVSVAAERCNLCLGLGVLEFEENKSSGKDRLHGTGKEERRGPSSWWRVGMDDRGWLLCGNCLHKSCYEVSFFSSVYAVARTCIELEQFDIVIGVLFSDMIKPQTRSLGKSLVHFVYIIS